MEQSFSVIWGTDVREEVFRRWMQGFEFSEDEPLALLQYSGGPCAIIAPVQAYILKKRLFEQSHGESSVYLDTEGWRDCPAESARDLLVQALVHILCQSSSGTGCKLVTLKDKSLNETLARGRNQSSSHAFKAEATFPQAPSEEKPFLAASSSEHLKTSEHSKTSLGYEEESTEKIGPAKMGELKQETGQMTVLSEDRMASLMRQAADGAGRSRGGGVGGTAQPGAKITLDILSSALGNVSPSLPSHQHGTEWRGPETIQHCSQQRQPVRNVTAPTTSRKHLSQLDPPNTSLSSQQRTSVSEHVQPTRTPPSPLLPPAMQPRESVSRKPFSDATTTFRLNASVSEHATAQELAKALRLNMADLEGPFGILLFLHSVVLTKGVSQLLEEREEKEQPLIDPVYGHGSQSLVNLLVVGRAVTNVFDMDKDLGGIKLKGIPRQACVGFLTILEALRYCEVGSFLKSPIHPIWLIGSETHITVLFSTEVGLAAQEESRTNARREFTKFDPDERGFILPDHLGELLKALGLETDPDYVEYMKKKLDSEDTGVIVLENFLTEFFPFEMDAGIPRAFPLYHYNGLLQHSHRNKVQFSRGHAVILGEEGGTSSETTLLNCLHTKWPALIVDWEGTCDPKII